MLVSAEDATIKVTADVSFGGKDKKLERMKTQSTNNHIKNVEFLVEGKVLHIGPDLLLLYNCYDQAADGKCTPDKAEAALFSKTRYIRHHDRLSLYPHFAKTCIPYDKSFFLNLHCNSY